MPRGVSGSLPQVGRSSRQEQAVRQAGRQMVAATEVGSRPRTLDGSSSHREELDRRALVLEVWLSVRGSMPFS